MKGSTLRRIRKSLRETQMQFARRFGVHQTTYCSWERDGTPQNGTAPMAIKTTLAKLKSEDER